MLNAKNRLDNATMRNLHPKFQEKFRKLKPNEIYTL